MPLLGPIITAAMGWLAGWMGRFALWILGLLALKTTQKVVWTTAAFSSILVLTGVFVGLVKAALLTIVYAFPFWGSLGVAMFVPSNAPLVLGVLISAKTARWVYDFHMARIDRMLMSLGG